MATRLASASATAGRAAYWNELNPVTTSKLAASYGRSSSSPSSSGAPGTRARAWASRPSLASSPVTSAPRSAASRRNMPAPQPASSSRVLGPTFSASSADSYAAATWRSWIAAQSSARTLHNLPSTSAVPVCVLLLIDASSVGMWPGSYGPDPGETSVRLPISAVLASHLLGAHRQHEQPPQPQ